MFVKVSMDGAPYLRKIDLKVYKGYPELLQALQNMFKFTIGKKKRLIIVVVKWSDFGDYHEGGVLMISMAYGFAFQVITQRERATRDQNMYPLMKTKTVTGCWLAMFHGSKFSFPAYPSPGIGSLI